jgi:hypothetical protein
MSLFCRLLRHPFGEWHAYTWTRTRETLNFAVRSCWCGKRTEAIPIHAEPVLAMTEAGAEPLWVDQGRVTQWVH